MISRNSIVQSNIPQSLSKKCANTNTEYKYEIANPEMKPSFEIIIPCVDYDIRFAVHLELEFLLWA
jgi:hypothetical protein